MHILKTCMSLSNFIFISPSNNMLENKMIASEKTLNQINSKLVH